MPALGVSTQDFKLPYGVWSNLRDIHRVSRHGDGHVVGVDEPLAPDVQDPVLLPCEVNGQAPGRLTEQPLPGDSEEGGAPPSQAVHSAHVPHGGANLATERVRPLSRVKYNPPGRETEDISARRRHSQSSCPLCQQHRERPEN